MCWCYEMNVFVQVSCCRHAPTGSERVEDSCLSRAALRAQHGKNWPLNSSRVAKKKNGKKIWFMWPNLLRKHSFDSASGNHLSHTIWLFQFSLSTYLVSNILVLAHMCSKAPGTSVCSTLQSCFVISLLIQHHVLRIPFSCSTFSCNPVCSLASTSWTW